MPLELRGSLLALVGVLEREGRLAKPQGKIVDRDNRIFEIRAKEDKLKGRVLYCYLSGSGTIYGLVAFIKKTRRIPKEMIDLARKRLKLLLKGGWR
jgi:phage-related protein